MKIMTTKQFKAFIITLLKLVEKAKDLKEVKEYLIEILEQL